jgi:hypothetical protein
VIFHSNILPKFLLSFCVSTGSRSLTNLNIFIHETCQLSSTKLNISIFNFQAKSAQFPSGYSNLLPTSTFVLRAHGASRIDWLLEAPLADQLEVIGFPGSERARFFRRAAGRAGRRRVPACGGGRAESQSLGD